MTSRADHTRDYESAKARLEQIAAAVDDDALPLDEALDLFEEAVALGLQVSDLMEEGIVVDEAGIPAEGAAAEGADAPAEGPATDASEADAPAAE